MLNPKDSENFYIQSSPKSFERDLGFRPESILETPSEEQIEIRGKISTISDALPSSSYLILYFLIRIYIIISFFFLNNSYSHIFKI